MRSSRFVRDLDRDCPLRAVANGVLEERLQDPVEEIRLDCNEHRVLGNGAADLDAPFVGVLLHQADPLDDDISQIACRPLRDPPPVCAAETSASTVPWPSARTAMRSASRLPPVCHRPSLSAQCEFCLGGDLRERCPELMGQLGGEPLLVPQARGEPLEQRVEGRGQAASARRTARRDRMSVETAGRSRPPIVGHRDILGSNALPRIQWVSTVTARSGRGQAGPIAVDAIEAVSFSASSRTPATTAPMRFAPCSSPAARRARIRSLMYRARAGDPPASGGDCRRDASAHAAS